MKKRFNVTGICIPEKHYMVDITGKIDHIVDDYIEPGYYFTINRARQYGKTTTLYMLEERLKNKYYIISISFEGADDIFESRETFVRGFLDMVGRELIHGNFSAESMKRWLEFESEELPFQLLSEKISTLCRNADKEIILQIDEVDKSSDNQLFLTFLGILRDKYLDKQRGRDASFHNVILCGVYDIKNLKLKLRSESEHKYNSPWNIAEDFNVEMAFCPNEIASMLNSYEKDHKYGIDVNSLSHEIYDYTSGYPYLVSQICKLLDEVIWKEEYLGENPASVWCSKGLKYAIKYILTSRSTLFDDINKNLDLYPKLNDMVHQILLKGRAYPFSLADNTVQLGVMFGYFYSLDFKVAITNRIFETYLYDLFYLNEMKNSELAVAGIMEHQQFIEDGCLNMNRVLERFKAHYDSIYGMKEWKFIEDEGRFLFLTFLKPIINGKGNYYVEARTRDQKRTDIIVDYNGWQYIIELKIWHGEEYMLKGKRQLIEYLDSYEQKEGWLISFCFNKMKEKKTGIHKIYEGGKVINEIII